MDQSTTIAVDLAKSVFEVAVAIAAGAARFVSQALELAGFVGHRSRFPSGRHFASYLDNATVAPANTLARYAWAVATHEVPFETKAKAA